MDVLSVKWKNHCSAFIQLLGTVRRKQMFTDVTLTCSGKFYGAHQLVLTSCSDYFKDIFDHIECDKPVIVLNGVSSDNLEALLDYIYLGEVNVKQCDLSSLIKAAEYLKIKGLADSESSNQPDNSPGVKSQTSSRPKRKRKFCESDSPNMPEGPTSKVKSFKPDKNKTLQNIPSECEVVPSTGILPEENKAIFIKEEFVKSEPFLLTELNPDQTLSEARDNSLNVFTDEASSDSHTHESIIDETCGPSEMLQYQDNISSWQEDGQIYTEPGIQDSVEQAARFQVANDCTGNWPQLQRTGDSTECFPKEAHCNSCEVMEYKHNFLTPNTASINSASQISGDKFANLVSEVANLKSLIKGMGRTQKSVDGGISFPQSNQLSLPLTKPLAPANTLDELDQLLKEEDLKSSLMALRGKNIQDTTRRIIRRLLSKELAQQFSLTGLGYKRMAVKHSFRDHNVGYIVVDTLITMYPETTLKEAWNNCRNVIRSAPDWLGGRVRLSKIHASSSSATT